MKRHPTAAPTAYLAYLVLGLLVYAGQAHAADIQPILRLTGPPPPPLFASSMANAGDFNGDGYEDLIISAPNPRPSESEPPHARIYFGGPAADSIPDIVIEGFVPAVASAGDMNGDGYGDIVVPHPASGTLPQARVYFGGREPDGVPDLFLYCEQGDWLGFWGSAAASDFNGDGFTDVLLAAPGYWEPDEYRNVGRAYLFLGGVSPDGNPDATLETPTPLTYYGEYFARHVASAGDLNRDGFGDFLVTNDGTPFFGAALVYLGGQEMDTLPDASVRTLFVAGTQGPFVTAAGDMNADGLQDVAVQGGIPTANGYTGGRVFVYFSATDSNSTRAPDLVVGKERGTAYSIVGGRDVNGDGHPDLLLGHGSSVSVFFGGAHVDSVADLTLYGEQSGDGFGFRVSVLDWTGDGVADVAVTAPVLAITGRGPGRVYIYDLAEPLRARGFTESDQRTIPIAGAPPAPLHVRFEPMDGSYASADVDPLSIRLRSEGTGEVTEIPAVAGKATFGGDRDGNGVSDLLASFSGADLARLFSNVVGRKVVDVTLEGRLRSRRRFAAPFSLTIVGTGPRGDLTAAVRPNPLNPRGTLAFRTASLGAVTARLFDLHGRCVRVLLQMQSLEAGDHRIPIDGRDDAGRDLASGVYFYRIDSVDGPARGRVVIAK